MAETLVSEGNEQFLKKALLRPTLANEVQTLTITGVPTGGTFKLRYEGQLTGTIAFNANAAAVQSALEALSNVGVGDMVITGSNPSFTLTGGAQLANTPLALPVLDSNVLTGGSLPSVAIARTTAGAGCIRQYLYVGLATQTREALGDSVTLATLTEVGNAGSGYSRQRLLTDGVEIVISFEAGFWKFKTIDVTFTCTTPAWSAANSIFLTDDPVGTTGKIYTLRTISAFTLGIGQSTSLNVSEVSADPA